MFGPPQVEFLATPVFRESLPAFKENRERINYLYIFKLTNNSLQDCSYQHSYFINNLKKKMFILIG